MEAAHKISLYPGFHAERNCSFRARMYPEPILSTDSENLDLLADSTDNKTDQNDIKTDTKEEIPTVFSCSQNYPNPFNSSTTIKYGLPVDSDVSLCIYNILGQKVKGINMKQSAGYKSFVWDRTNDAGNVIGNGMYFYVLKAGDNKANKKMLVLK